MSNFLNGPAAGVTLSLGRSPYFLRVVMSPAGKWDALDQLEDTPAADEQIHVYRIASEPAVAHIDGRDPKTGKRYGRWLSVADYVLHDEQPDDRSARDTAAWRKWTEKQGLKLAADANQPKPGQSFLGQCLDDRQKAEIWKQTLAAGDAK